MDTETDSLSTETDFLDPKRTGRDFCEYRNGLCGYRILIWGVKTDRNTKNRYKLQCQAFNYIYKSSNFIKYAPYLFCIFQHSDMNDEMRTEAMELCVTACEKFASNNEVSLIVHEPDH